jgi:FMN-dependent NADH-azoreductase
MNAVNSSTTSLLYLDASPRGERSASRRLGAKYLAAWQAAHQGAPVVTRDLGRTPPPFVTEAWVEGAYAPADQQSPAARDAMAISNAYVDELLAANEVVIATPIYNLSIPAMLKAWIDQIVRAGRTFNRGSGGFVGLAGGKRVTVIVSSGGDLRPSGPGAAYNFVEPYLRTVFGFIGITDVRFVYAHSLNSGNDALTEQSLSEAGAALDQFATAAA